MRTCFGVGKPNDPQFTISAAHSHAVCYAIKGNYIDRDTKQNGKGWSDDGMYTLDATDRHGVCYLDKARSLTARYDSSPCVDRGQNIVCVLTSDCEKSERGGVRVWDARGNGNGTTVPTLTGNHQDRITDYTAVVVTESVLRDA